MPPFLLALFANVRFWLYGIGAIALFTAGGYVTHQWDKSALENALKEQETALIAQCDKDKATTARIDNDQLQKINDLSKRLSSLKRLHSARCVPVANSASSNNGSTAKAGIAGTHGVTAESLYDLASEGEKYAITLESCQDFIRSERK